MTWLFGIVDTEAKKRAGYKTRSGSCMDRGFRDLEYDLGIVWMNGPGGGLHYEDFWDLVAERVVL